MAVLRSLVRIAGAVGASAALACAGSTAATAAPFTQPGPAALGPQAPATGPRTTAAGPQISRPVTGPAASAAAKAAIAGAGRTDTAQGDVLGAYQSAVDALQRFGMDSFLYPSAAAFCQDGSTLGLVPAIAGAVPGPWPKTTVSVPGVDPSTVKSGQTMFAFVPYGLGQDGTDTSGMQVAWFNATTGQGGLAPMGSLAQVATTMVPPQVPLKLRPLAQQAIQNFLATALPLGGVRAVPVNTGTGTVLAAMFGSVRNGARSCLFLPTVGVTEVH